MRFSSFSGLCALAVLPVAFAQHYPVVGAQSGINARTGETPARRNINELYQEAGPQWDLYVASLAAMQAADELDPTSYFQIAAIHGEPYMPWPGGGPQEGSGGFCPHNEAQFGSWHRAYLTLYEQVLVQTAQRIAEQYPIDFRRQYTEAAERLRAPFWDWAEDSRIPPVMALPTVFVTQTIDDSIERVEVDNPLSGYKYPDSVLRGDFGTFGGRNATKRCVNPGENFPGTPNEVLSGRDLKTTVYNALVRAESWAEIGTMAHGPNNIEGPHGTIHIYAACGEDFYYLSTAAFDPLFMLHHTNVDRLLAYWQALNYQNPTVDFDYETNGLFGSPEGTVITPRSPVAPFEGNNGPLTSEDFINIQDWGYTYEPLRFWDQSAGQRRMAVTRTINQLYGPEDVREPPEPSTTQQQEEPSSPPEHIPSSLLLNEPATSTIEELARTSSAWPEQSSRVSLEDDVEDQTENHHSGSRPIERPEELPEDLDEDIPIEDIDDQIEQGFEHEVPDGHSTSPPPAPTFGPVGGKNETQPPEIGQDPDRASTRPGVGHHSRPPKGQQSESHSQTKTRKPGSTPTSSPEPTRNDDKYQNGSKGRPGRPHGSVQRKFFAKLKVERSELELPAAIELYVKGHHAGTFALLGMPKRGVSYDQIPLQHGLLGAHLYDNSPEDIVKELEDCLEIIISKPDGTTIPLETVPSLKVNIEDVDVKLPTSPTELPKFGTPKERPARVKGLVIKTIEVPLPC